MFIEAVLKCDVDHTPYRIYINDELITERFYTITNHRTISNDLVVLLEDPALGNMNVNFRGDEIAPDGTITKTREQIMREYADSYDVRVESLTDTPVILESFSTKEKLDEDK